MLREYKNSCSIKTISCNAHEGEIEEYEHDIYATYTELYDKKVHGNVEDV